MFRKRGRAGKRPVLFYSSLPPFPDASVWLPEVGVRSHPRGSQAADCGAATALSLLPLPPHLSNLAFVL